MHPIDVGILEEFRRDPTRSFSTTDLVRALFREEYALLNHQVHDADKKTRRKGYAKKAKLHRKLLYHMNKLVKSNLLRSEGVIGKGEKLYQLSLEEGDLVIESGPRRIVISKPSTVTTQIDGYEKEGFVRKYRPETWMNKHSAILLDCRAYTSLIELSQRLHQVFPLVSDTVAIYRFERLLGTASKEELYTFLHDIALDAHDYDVSLSVLIDLSALQQEERLLQVLRLCFADDSFPPYLTFLFETVSRNLIKYEHLAKGLIELYVESKKKLHLKNNAIFTPPIFFGRAGTYTFTEEDWTYYEEHVRDKADGCVVGEVTLAIDVNRFFQQGTITGFREMLRSCTHALFEVDEMRRRRFSEHFGHLTMPSPDGMKGFYAVSRHFIRFWNYVWEEPELPILDLLTSVKEEIATFSQMQETIFKSCGLPIRYRVAISTSFLNWDQDFFSEKRYQKTVLKMTKELQTKSMKEYIAVRERLFNIFEGSDRLRFFLTQGIPHDEALRIIHYLLRATDLPSITLDFRGKTGEMKLTNFLEGY